MTVPCIFGLGSPAGDDRAGWVVLERLFELGYPRNRLKRLGNPAELLNDLPTTGPIIVCDACAGPGPAGGWHRRLWPCPEVQSRPGRGSHDMPLENVLGLARELQLLPEVVELWLVEGRAWVPESPITECVRDSACAMAGQLWEQYHA